MSISQAGFENKTVKIHTWESVRTWEAPARIIQVMSVGWRVLVLLDWMDKQEAIVNRNIFCLDSDGKVVWQVSDPTGGDKMGGFTRISLVRGNRLGVNNWNSFWYEIDIETGKLSNATFTK